MTGHGLEKAIRNEFSGDIMDGLIAILECTTNKAEFFAKRLHKSMAGIGTNDNQLIRVIVTRCEIDLNDIKVAFERLYGKSLRSWIKVNIILKFDFIVSFFWIQLANLFLILNIFRVTLLATINMHCTHLLAKNVHHKSGKKNLNFFNTSLIFLSHLLDHYNEIFNKLKIFVIIYYKYTTFK